MARSRNIKPSFFTNDVLTECSFAARLLFAGLWTIADKAGRLEDRPKKIKGEIFPHDDVSVDELLGELAKHKFIIRYQVGENKYIQVVNFTKHQNPHKNETDSTIPDLEQEHAKSELVEKLPEPSRIYPEHSGLTPLTDSLIPHPSSSSLRSQRASAEHPAFAGWYEEYPHKVGRAGAAKAFQTAIGKAKVELLLLGLRRYIASKPPDRSWCNPATWLNQERWNDEPQEINHENTGRNHTAKPTKTDRAKAALLRSAEALGFAGESAGQTEADQSNFSVFSGSETLRQGTGSTGEHQPAIPIGFSQLPVRKN